MALLQIEDNTKISYEEYENLLLEKYNFEVDMYGDSIDENEYRDLLVKEFKEDIIPASKLKDHEYMEYIRSWRTTNINMPGT